MPLADGKSHTLSFEGTERSAVLMLASDPKPVKDHLNEAIADAQLSEGARQRAHSALVFYDASLAPISGAAISDPPTPQQSALLTALPDNLNALTALLIAIPDPPDASAVPAPTWSYQGPVSASVEKLSNVHSTGGQDARSGQPKGWPLIVQQGLTQSGGRWVRMHMISAAYGGLDIATNLVPTPTAINTGSSVRQFETKVEAILYGKERAADVRADRSLFAADLAQRPAVIWLSTTTGGFHPASTQMVPNTNNPIYDATTFVTSVSLTAGMYYPKGADWVKDPTPLASGGAGVPEPVFTGTYIPGINSLGEGQLKDRAGISLHYAREICKLQPFYSAVELSNKAVAAGKDTEGMTDAIQALALAVIQNKLKWGD